MRTKRPEAFDLGGRSGASRPTDEARLDRAALLKRYVALAQQSDKTGDATVTKKDLVNRIAECTVETKVVTKATVQLFLDAMIWELTVGNRLEFRDFGVFEVKSRRARRAQNPRTLEKVAVPPKKVVKFKVGRLMKEKVTDVVV